VATSGRRAGGVTGLFSLTPDASIGVEHICDFEIFFQPMQTISSPSGVTRVTLVVESGTARGPLLNGEFLPGGGDWITFGADSIARLDVRATIRADDGHLVAVTSTGRHVGSDDSVVRYAAGELIEWDQAYTRSAPLFETDSPRYRWLNGIAAVAVNEVAVDRVHYRVYRVT
jgi:hypothetical protein